MLKPYVPAFLIFALAAGTLQAQPLTDTQRIEALEKKVEQLEQLLRVSERKQEIKAEEVAAAPAPALVTANADGFIIKSADGNFNLRVGGYGQFDGRFFPDGATAAAPDTFVMRKMRPELRGTIFKYVDIRLLPDFGAGSVALMDAYAELKYFPRLALRAGKFKTPVGIGRLQSDTDTWFTELGAPSSLVPARDIGVQLSGDIVKDRVAYQGAVVNGVVDNTNTGDGDTNAGKDYAGRIIFSPWKPNKTSVLSGLSFGLSGTTGNQVNGALPSFKTAGQNTYFSFVAGSIGYGNRKRLSPQASYFVGSLGIIAEYVSHENSARRTATAPIVRLNNYAWGIESAFLLTGEKKTYGAVTPKKNFDLKSHGWGAWELALRSGALGVDRAAYASGLANPLTAARYEREWAGGVNWYLNRAVKFQFDFIHADFSGGAAGGANRPTEKSIMTRLQFYL